MDYRLVLMRLGVAPNYKGYHQMLTELGIVEVDPEALTLVTKRLYPAIAKRHHARWKQVEREFHHIIRPFSALYPSISSLNICKIASNFVQSPTPLNV